MQARVKDKYRWKVVTACGGREYIKGEYRPVPEGFEGEVQGHPALEVESAQITGRSDEKVSKSKKGSGK